MDKRLLVLACGMFAIGTDSFVVSGLLRQVSVSLGVSIALAGQMVTVFALSYALLSPVVAAAAAHWPRKRLLLAGLAVLVVGDILTAVAPTIKLVLASRLLSGLAAAMFSPTASATAASLAVPEQRGRALSIVITGLSCGTAFGAPLGVFVGGLLDWRATMWFAAGLGTLAWTGVALLLSDTPSAPVVDLARRLAPLRDTRVVLTLLTILLVFTGLFIVHTYIDPSFDRVTGGNQGILAALLLLRGVAATAGSLVAGRLTDRFGSRGIINAAAAILFLDFALLPWTSTSLTTAAPALVVWGLFGWGLLVPQQLRLIGITPSAAPLLLGLNQTAIYLAVSASGVLGGAAVTWFDHHTLGIISAVFIGAGLVTSELAHRHIIRSHGSMTSSAAIPSGNIP
ncbi:MFS transporter [Rhizobium paranaense]|uniref:Putative MFS family arabinose efflux permease n=1 Tax=Rhizobium paranaense TaxID=1650438 RepID=A0A7W8XSC0_9HYPH|nr:MFS transporter [Rhizobium paranaense]MBB5574690.1 putative MFS family arabinose efflux permease [Rhizobium paranaense]